MEIILIRHTTPAIEKGICYGWSDIAVAAGFAAEARRLRKEMAATVESVYASPLMRCRQLAEYLYPEQAVEYRDELKEMNFGQWELKPWDEIPKQEMDAWMEDFVQVPVPGGESFSQLHQRCQLFWEEIRSPERNIALITHAGVIRSFLSLLHQTDLKDAFRLYNPAYGSVTRVRLN